MTEDDINEALEQGVDLDMGGQGDAAAAATNGTQEPAAVDRCTQEDETEQDNPQQMSWHETK